MSNEGIVVASPKNIPTLYDAILIDDTKLIRMIWTREALKLNKKLLTFSNVKDFYCAQEAISRESPIYIDCDLGENTFGHVEAKYIFSELGFNKIILATNHPAHVFESMPWILAIKDKSTPWGKA